MSFFKSLFSKIKRSQSMALIDPDKIKEHLKHPDKTTIISLPTVDSTNAALKAAAEKGAPNRQILIAAHQSHGRGRLGRAFHSPEGTGLYLSMLFYDSHNPGLCEYLTMAAGVIVYEAIADVFGIDTELKWVNDIYYDDKKIGGILAEHVLHSSASAKKNYTVLGIGLNLFEPDGGFPEEIADIAGALFPSRAHCSPEQIRTFIARLIEYLWDLGDARNPNIYINIYRRHSWVLNRKVILTQGAEKIIGTVMGFNQWGHLILEKENGEIETFSGGEITLRICNARDEGQGMRDACL